MSAIRPQAPPSAPGGGEGTGRVGPQNGPPDAAASLLTLPSDGFAFRLLAAAMLALCAAYSLAYLGIAVWHAGGRPPGDFFGLWSSGRFVLAHPTAQVYDPAALHAAQVALGMDARTSYPFPYPPSFLLVLAPLALLPRLPAYAVAIGVTLVLFVWATVGTRWRSPMMLAALAAPTTAITIVAGQAGFLAAALLIGGLRLIAARPVLAGVLFGLLTYKPQMGLLVPVALIAAKLWRTLAAACATAAVLVAVTSLAFGWMVWPAWAADIFAYARQFAAESSAIVHFMPTVSVSLARLGVPPALANIAQLAVAAAAAWAVWRCFRLGATRLAMAALMVATFLATPHAFVYDMPALATAVIWFAAERRQAAAPFAAAEILVMMFALIAPIALVTGSSRMPFTPLVLILMLGAIVRRQQQTAGFAFSSFTVR